MKQFSKILIYMSVMFLGGLILAWGGTGQFGWSKAQPVAALEQPVMTVNSTVPYRPLLSRLNSANGSPIAHFVRTVNDTLHHWPELLTSGMVAKSAPTHYWDGQSLPDETQEVILVNNETPPNINISASVDQSSMEHNSLKDTMPAVLTMTTPITETAVVTEANWPSQRLNILLVGADGRNGDKAGRSDTIIVVSLDPLSHTVAMMSLPRDLWLTIPGYAGQRRINSAYRLGEQRNLDGGGAALLKETLAQNFGITIDYYAQINFEGFEKMVDTLGGVEVDVPEMINTAAFYGFTPKYINRNGHYTYVPAKVVTADGKPVQNAWELVTQTTYITDDAILATAEPGYKMLYLETGRQTLDGVAALQYARSRAFLSADFVRMQHQQAVLLAIRQKVLQGNLLARLPDMWLALHDSINTDLPLTEMIKLATLMPQIQPEAIHTLTIDYTLTKDFTTDKGARVLLPMYDKINPLTQSLFGATPLTTTTMLTPTATITATITK